VSPVNVIKHLLYCAVHHQVLLNCQLGIDRLKGHGSK
jgi:hypothetical protein